MKAQDLVCHLDFETRCDRDIDDGLAQYFDSPYFGMMCAAWAIGDEPVELWTPGEPLPRRLVEHIRSGGRVAAHNAPFERGVTRTLAAEMAGWPPLQDEQLECTMARCLQHNLPAGLDDAAKALGLRFQKCEVGQRIMKKWCKPRPSKGTGITWWPHDPDEFLFLGRYCMGDVEQERAVEQALFPMPPSEKKFWILDQQINQRGVPVAPLELEAACRVLAEAESRANAEMFQVTGGAVKTVNCTAALAEFCQLPSANAEDVEIALAVTRDPIRRRALEIRVESGLASVKKIKALRRWISPDSRVRGMYQYHGAGVTGREAGRGPQPQNMAKPVLLKLKDVLQFFEGLALDGWSFDDVLLLFGPPMRALADAVRGFFVAPKGRKFVQVDFSSFEGRILAWMAGEEWALEVYRTHGKMYEATAAAILGKSIADVTPEERQDSGKVPELSLGYQGGAGALARGRAKAGLPPLPEDRLEEIKTLWRRARPRTVQLWTDAEQCAMAAVAHPGHQARIRKPYIELLYQVVDAPGGVPFLFCRLPSGRNIAYPHPAIEPVETPWGEVKMQVTYLRRHPQRKHQFVRENVYGGKWVENWVQAAQRDAQRDQMLRFDERGWPIIHHCHDEVLNEVPDEPEWSVEAAREIARTVPGWAKGLPIDAGGWEGNRYRK